MDQIRSLQDKHSDMVKVLAKPGEEIIEELTPVKAHLWHMASCVCGEAGELFDAVKKGVIYGKPLDVENIIEELGDIEFYMEGIRQGLNITRESTLHANQLKLAKRYESGKYSNEQAQNRADKVEIHNQLKQQTLEETQAKLKSDKVVPITSKIPDDVA